MNGHGLCHSFGKAGWGFCCGCGIFFFFSFPYVLSPLPSFFFFFGCHSCKMEAGLEQ